MTRGFEDKIAGNACVIIACRECDALQREVALPPHGAARCVRCGAFLYRYTQDSLDHTLAYLLAAACFFVIANAFPLVGLETQGSSASTTLFGTVRALHDTGMTSVAVLVFMTAILIPGIEIAAMLYMLLPLKFGRVPPGLPVMFRLAQAIRPWGMVDVCMLGTLVTLVRLSQLATVRPGVALWALGALMLMFTAANAAFNPRALWARVREARQ
jgi:paraquat-inducible protein A